MLNLWRILNKESPMKKKNKRLALHRETVRNLDDSGLQKAAGGTLFTRTGAQCGTSCRCIDYPDTFSADCTAECPATSEG
jgi:hypothetical protein